MKKTVLFLMMTVAAMATYAQQQKGDFQLQGQISYNSVTDNGTTTSYGLVQLNVSRFFTDRIEAGVAPILFLNKDAGFSRFAFFGNYSFLTQNAKLVPYAGLQIMLTSQKSISVDANGNITSGTETTTGFGLRGGLRYFITEKVNIDVGPNITFDKTSTFIFNVGVGVILGKH
ncbi:MAG: outer membrane beta-barrel protein [Bacteroidetes bacterium]|nr:outer membrane beta-barrel protein [Bacteroidota bacterium]MBS1540728.1 outer membrane beta-barrel protein [Bacteroidota bacterium]